MKLFLILALILNLAGYGEIPEEGLDLVVTETEIDLTTDKPVMSLEGDLMADGPLNVTITRSQSGLTDQFCCGECLYGNGQTEQILQLSPQGPTDWNVHYYPTANSDVQITYHFADSEESRELRVHYIYSAQGIEQIKNQKSKIQKILLDGHVYIISNHQIYQLL